MYYIEVEVNRNCKCSNMIEGFFVTGEKEVAIEKIKSLYKTSKNYQIRCVYKCQDIIDGVQSAFVRYL